MQLEKPSPQDQPVGQFNFPVDQRTSACACTELATVLVLPFLASATFAFRGRADGLCTELVGQPDFQGFSGVRPNASLTTLKYSEAYRRADGLSIIPEVFWNFREKLKNRAVGLYEAFPKDVL